MSTLWSRIIGTDEKKRELKDGADSSKSTTSTSSPTTKRRRSIKSLFGTAGKDTSVLNDTKALLPHILESPNSSTHPSHDFTSPEHHAEPQPSNEPRARHSWSSGSLSGVQKNKSTRRRQSASPIRSRFSLEGLAGTIRATAAKLYVNNSTDEQASPAQSKNLTPSPAKSVTSKKSVRFRSDKSYISRKSTRSPIPIPIRSPPPTIQISLTGSGLSLSDRFTDHEALGWTARPPPPTPFLTAGQDSPLVDLDMTQLKGVRWDEDTKENSSEPFPLSPLGTENPFEDSAVISKEDENALAGYAGNFREQGQPVNQLNMPQVPGIVPDSAKHQNSLEAPRPKPNNFDSDADYNELTIKLCKDDVMELPVRPKIAAQVENDISSGSASVPDSGCSTARFFDDLKFDQGDPLFLEDSESGQDLSAYAHSSTLGEDDSLLDGCEDEGSDKYSIESGPYVTVIENLSWNNRSGRRSHASDEENLLRSGIQQAAASDPTKVDEPECVQSMASPSNNSILPPRNTTSPLNLSATVPSNPNAPNSRPFKIEASPEALSTVEPVDSATFSLQTIDVTQEPSSPQGHKSKKRKSSSPIMRLQKSYKIYLPNPSPEEQERHRGLNWSPFNEPLFLDIAYEFLVVDPYDFCRVLTETGITRQLWINLRLPEKTQPPVKAWPLSQGGLEAMIYGFILRIQQGKLTPRAEWVLNEDSRSYLNTLYQDAIGEKMFNTPEIVGWPEGCLAGRFRDVSYTSSLNASINESSVLSRNFSASLESVDTSSEEDSKSNPVDAWNESGTGSRVRGRKSMKDSQHEDGPIRSNSEERREHLQTIERLLSPDLPSNANCFGLWGLEGGFSGWRYISRKEHERRMEQIVSQSILKPKTNSDTGKSGSESLSSYFNSHTGEIALCSDLDRFQSIYEPLTNGQTNQTTYACNHNSLNKLRSDEVGCNFCPPEAERRPRDSRSPEKRTRNKGKGRSASWTRQIDDNTRSQVVNGSENDGSSESIRSPKYITQSQREGRPLYRSGEIKHNSPSSVFSHREQALSYEEKIGLGLSDAEEDDLYL